jgi:hypothetical protein
MICIDQMREWYGAFAECGPLAEDSAAKLKRGQINVYCVRTVYSFPQEKAKNLRRIDRKFASVVGNSDVCGK